MTRLTLSRRAPTSRRARGLTLVELLVAMLLGLLITLAATAALIVARRGFTSVDAASQLRDNARFATDLVQRLAVQAGYKDVGYAATQRGMSIDLSATPPLSVLGFDNATVDQSLTPTTRTGTPFGDVLVLRFQPTETYPGSNAADAAMIDCAGHEASTLAKSRDDMHTSVLFVAESQGEPTLMCYRSNTGSPPFDNSRPLISGVETFQVLYGVDGVKPKAAIDPADTADTVPERYLRADELTVASDTGATQANWRRVRSLRIGMILRSDIGGAQEVATRTLYPLGSSAFASAQDAGSIFTAPPDGRLRQVVTFTVHLRNDQGL
jgi:type IV pilus assembly protein PilW